VVDQTAMEPSGSVEATVVAGTYGQLGEGRGGVEDDDEATRHLPMLPDRAARASGVEPPSSGVGPVIDPSEWAVDDGPTIHQPPHELLLQLAESAPRAQPPLSRLTGPALRTRLAALRSWRPSSLPFLVAAVVMAGGGAGIAWFATSGNKASPPGGVAAGAPTAAKAVAPGPAPAPGPAGAAPGPAPAAAGAGPAASAAGPAAASAARGAPAPGQPLPNAATPDSTGSRGPGDPLGAGAALADARSDGERPGGHALAGHRTLPEGHAPGRERAIADGGDRPAPEPGPAGDRVAAAPGRMAAESIRAAASPDRTAAAAGSGSRAAPVASASRGRSRSLVSTAWSRSALLAGGDSTSERAPLPLAVRPGQVGQPVRTRSTASLPAAAAGPGTGRPSSPLIVTSGRMRRESGGLPRIRLPSGEPAPPQLTAKLCVDPRGSVTSVTVLSAASPLVRASVERDLSRWRYRPVIEGAESVSACFASTFRVQVE